MSNTIEAYIGEKGKEKVTFKDCKTVNGIRLFKYDGNYYKITRSSDGRNIATIENTKLSSPASSDTEDKTSTVQEQELDTNVYYYSNVANADYPVTKESYNRALENNSINTSCLSYKTNESILGSTPISQQIIDYTHFSNFTSVNSSYVEIGFKAGSNDNNWECIDTNKMNNYIVGLSSDNQGGVQKITLELFDRDFNVLDNYINNAIKWSQSTKILNTNDKRDKEINNAVNENYKNDINEIRKENEEGTATECIKSLDKQIIDLNIKISNLTSNTRGNSPEIPKLKTDMNELILKRRGLLSNPPTIDIESIENKSGLTPNLKIRFGYTDKNYDNDSWSIHQKTITKENGEKETVYKDSKGNEKTKKDFESSDGYLYKSNIDSSGSTARWQEGKIIDYENTSSDNDQKITRDSTSNFIHYNQSTIRSPEFKLFITGLKSSVTTSGIHYTIEAMEIQDLEMLNYGVVERYTVLKGTPKDIMHYFTNAFNKDIKDSKLRIVWIDKIPIYEEKNIEEENKKIDNNASEHASDGTKNAITETTTTDKNNIPIKEISISLGGKNAEENGYWDGKKFVGATMFKSISSLFDDYCNACPRAPDYSSVITKNSVQKDEKGNDVPIQNSMDFSTRKMGWKIIKKLNGITYVGFYYVKPKKFPYIRKYVWGNGSMGNTVVKNISLETENEYALLSAQDTLKDNDQVQKRKILNLGVESTVAISINDEKIISSTNNGSLSAYENCVYKGTMTVIGDPSYMFGEALLPYEYPIYIDILIKGSSNEASSQTARHHYSSGFYVITGIKHDISTSGYVTTLSVMTYPGIENQILINKS